MKPQLKCKYARERSVTPYVWGMTRRTGVGLCDPSARLAGKGGLSELKMTGFFAVFGNDWDELPSKAPPREDNWVSIA